MEEKEKKNLSPLEIIIIICIIVMISNIIWNSEICNFKKFFQRGDPEIVELNYNFQKE
jgi:hypothetical protein